MVFHVLNRGVGRMRIFDDDGDYFAFERIMEETLETRPMRICAYCLMPNHWHMVLWPENDGELAAFMLRLSVTHVARWRRHKDRVGQGTFIKDALSRSRSKRTIIFTWWFATSSATRCGQTWSMIWTAGVGRVSGDSAVARLRKSGFYRLGRWPALANGNAMSSVRKQNRSRRLCNVASNVAARGDKNLGSAKLPNN